jgi:hypothetical protein
LVFGCGLTGGARREFGPWAAHEKHGVTFAAPASFGEQTLGGFALYEPPGQASPALFIAMAAVPDEARELSAAELWNDLRPRRHDPALSVQAIQTKIGGRVVGGCETHETGSRGWTYLLESGARPAAMLLIGTPDYWPARRAEAFRDAVLATVRWNER